MIILYILCFFHLCCTFVSSGSVVPRWDLTKIVPRIAGKRGIHAMIVRWWVPYCAMVKTCQNMSKHVLFSHTKRSFPHWWGSYKGIPNYGWDSLGLGPVTPIHAGMTILFCGEINQLLRRGLRIQRPRSSNPTHRWRESVTNCCEKSWINHRQQPWLSSISLSTSCNCWTSWTSPELKVLPSSQKSL